MLVRLILPCQHRSCDLWEYDPAEYQTMRELFGSSHKDIWKVLFRSGKPWLNSAADCGYQLSHPASPVSHDYISTIRMSRGRCFLMCFFMITSGMDEEGGAESLSGPVAGRTGRTTSDEDAGPIAL